MQVKCITISFAVTEVRQGNEIIISGEYVDSPRKPYLVEKLHSDACPLCSSGLDVKHTDVLILRQFVRSDGCMLPRRITGLCRPQQKRVATLVAMAQKAGNKFFSKILEPCIYFAYRTKSFN